ncbi:MAG: hypothetical protein Q9167_006479 [Letrouitia subvulpina]
MRLGRCCLLRIGRLHRSILPAHSYLNKGVGQMDIGLAEGGDVQENAEPDGPFDMGRCKAAKSSATSSPERSHIVYGCSLLYHEPQALLFAVCSTQPLLLSTWSNLDATSTWVSLLDHLDSGLLTRSYTERWANASFQFLDTDRWYHRTSR